MQINALTGFLISCLRFVEKYQNPISVFFSLYVLRKPTILLIDRKTKIRCLSARNGFRIFGEVFFQRIYDAPKIQLLEGDTVIDIGANQGFFSVLAAKQGCKVLSFEPALGAFKMLVKNLELNNVGGRAIAVQAAIGAYEGTVDLIQFDEAGGAYNTVMEGLAESLAQNNILPKSVQAVPCQTLESAFSEHKISTVKLCKIDCEGAELDIIRSLKPETADKVDAFVVEYHPECIDVQSLISEVLKWGTHHVSHIEMSPIYGATNILRFTHRRTFKDI